MLEYWYQALRAKYGIVIRCFPNREKVKNKLYRVRAEADDPELKGIAIVTSPTTNNELWLIKRKPDGEA